MRDMEIYYIEVYWSSQTILLHWNMYIEIQRKEVKKKRNSSQNSEKYVVWPDCDLCHMNVDQKKNISTSYTSIHT